LDSDRQIGQEGKEKLNGRRKILNKNDNRKREQSIKAIS
jgi:hypothetical protein